ncbi:MAG TPA: ribosome small subunit-dependent GTPase A [Chthonomonadaceae bacterium]|nr:ribosome small subunit-dependent GTPase A [Chthonomonadaceae bacterium]
MRNPAPVVTRGNAPVVEPSEEGLLEGLVLKVFSGAYLVQADPDKESRPQIYRCSLRGALKKKFTYSTSGSLPRRVLRAKQPLNSDVVAVGDRVRFLPIDAEEGIIEEVLPRRSRFARATFRGREQTLVTNLDQLVVVFACAEPNPDLWRLDRWLVSAECNGLEPLIIANKRDLVDEATFQERFGEYLHIGYRVLATSAKEGIGIEDLREALRGRISAFTGPSGVGKSSLLNAIQPGLHLATSDIGTTTFKGRHTTITRELIPLDSGGWVADTPGLRNLDLLEMSREEMEECFIEFSTYLETPCRFHNCRHENEPGCCLKAAVAAGHVSPRRYESFLQLARGR